MTVSERLQKLNEGSTVPVNARVSLSLHPDQLSNHGPTLVDLEGSGPSIDAYGAARHALRALYESATQIDTAHQSMLKPMAIVGAVYARGSAPTMRMDIPPERRPELASAMAASASRAAAAVQRNIDVVDSTIGRLSDWIAQKTTHPRKNDASVVAEANAVREYVKNLEPGKRMSFLQEACERGEGDVVFACLNAVPWVSGLDREQHGILRQFANEAFASRETRQRAALADVKGKIQVALTSYSTEYARRLPKAVADKESEALATLKGGVAA